MAEHSRYPNHFYQHQTLIKYRQKFHDHQSGFQIPIGVAK